MNLLFNLFLWAKSSQAKFNFPSPKKIICFLYVFMFLELSDPKIHNQIAKLCSFVEPPAHTHTHTHLKFPLILVNALSNLSNFWLVSKGPQCELHPNILSHIHQRMSLGIAVCARVLAFDRHKRDPGISDACALNGVCHCLLHHTSYSNHWMEESS
jgi:hypothetical protein